MAVGRLVREMAVGFAIDANASAGNWVEGGNEIVFVGVGFAVLLRGSHDARAIAGGGLGLLGLCAGMLNAAALTNGVVLSALPSAMARAAVVVTISAGAAAATMGALCFIRALEAPDERLLTLSSGTPSSFERPPR